MKSETNASSSLSTNTRPHGPSPAVQHQEVTLKDAIHHAQFAHNQEEEVLPGPVPPQGFTGIPSTDASGSGSTAGGPAAGTPATGPDYAAIAAQLSDTLNAMIAAVPDLQDIDPIAQKAQASTRGIPAAFVTEAVAAAEAVPMLNDAVSMTLAAPALQYINAFSLLASKIRKFERDLVYSIDVKKAANGKAALQIYSMAQSLARGGSSAATLTKYVASMKKALGRSGRTKKGSGPVPTPTQTAPTPAPTPAPVPTPTATSPSPAPVAVAETTAGPTVYVSTSAPGGLR